MDAAALITYPLSIDGSTFRGGNSYSFRLTVHPVSDPTIQTFSEIVLTANSPPTGCYRNLCTLILLFPMSLILKIHSQAITYQAFLPFMSYFIDEDLLLLPVTLTMTQKFYFST
jgi:hypothetical protein